VHVSFRKFVRAAAAAAAAAVHDDTIGFRGFARPISVRAAESARDIPDEQTTDSGLGTSGNYRVLARSTRQERSGTREAGRAKGENEELQGNFVEATIAAICASHLLSASISSRESAAN